MGNFSSDSLLKELLGRFKCPILKPAKKTSLWIINEVPKSIKLIGDIRCAKGSIDSELINPETVFI